MTDTRDAYLAVAEAVRRADEAEARADKAEHQRDEAWQQRREADVAAERLRGELSRLRIEQRRHGTCIDVVHLAHQREWSEHTFGPGPRTKGVLDHISKELKEIEDDPSDLREWVDVVILALDGAWRAGHLPRQIIDAIKAKQARNEARTWPDWRTMSADQAIEHDRSQDCACDHDGPHGFCHTHVEALIGGVCECPRPTSASADCGTPDEGRSQSDDEWLDEMFAEPARRMAELPEWARPVVTPPADDASGRTGGAA